MQRFVSLIGLSVIATVVIVSAVSSSESSRETVDATPLSDLTEIQQKQETKALKAQYKFLNTLQLELQQVMPDASKAIDVCRKRTDLLANSISQTMNIRMGWTSSKIRNLNNISPSWAKDLINQNHQQVLFVSLPNRELGVLKPIMTDSICINCHGKQNEIEPDVFSEILNLYPDDAATGFSEGEVRGYVWVEVPSDDKME